MKDFGGLQRGEQNLIDRGIDHRRQPNRNTGVLCRRQLRLRVHREALIHREVEVVFPSVGDEHLDVFEYRTAGLVDVAFGRIRGSCFMAIHL